MTEAAVVAEASPVMGVALGDALERCGFRLLARVRTAEALVRVVRRCLPSLVLVDLGLPAAAPTVRAVCAAAQSPAVLLVSDEGQDDLVVSLVCAGALGAVPRGVGPDALERALTAVRGGECVLPRALVSRVLGELRVTLAVSAASGPTVLTRREQQVLDLMRAGYSTAAIASRLVVAPVTVRSHVCAIRRKLRLDEPMIPEPRRAG